MQNSNIPIFFETIFIELFVLVSYLDELSVAGECAVEYLGLYQKLIKPTHWKVYLAARGVLPYIGNLITKVTFRNVAKEVQMQNSCRHSSILCQFKLKIHQLSLC